MNFLEMIENHPVFQNESWNPQHNPAIQIAVSLFWFGSNGNGAAVYQLENFFSIGYGTVNLYTQNVPTSVLGFFFSLLFWPTKEEHIEISQVIWRFSRFYWICWWNHHCFKSKTQTWWKTLLWLEEKTLHCCTTCLQQQQKVHFPPCWPSRFLSWFLFLHQNADFSETSKLIWWQPTPSGWICLCQC